MPGSRDLFDFVDLTEDSEYDSRLGEAITTLQIHHSTGLSYAGTRSLMDPGGRTVSANGLMTNTGELGEVVPLDKRPYTSATGFDRRCLTVECNNITLAPDWGISAACRTRFAELAVAMYRLGILKHLGRGEGGIIGHAEVPGTYATACPGPDMHLDAVSAEAKALYAGTAAAGGKLTPIEEEDEDDMKLYKVNNPKGGLHNTLWLVTPNRVSFFEDAYWQERLAARWDKKVETIDEADFYDEVGRFGLSRDLAGAIATGNAPRSWPFGS